MGLLDKLLKEGKETIESLASEENKEKISDAFSDLKNKAEELGKEITSDENKEAAKSLLNALKEDFGGVFEEAHQKEETKENLEAELWTEDESETRSCREKIIAVLNEEFPQYAYEENVSPTKLGGQGRFMNYSIVVYDGKTPKLCIMIIGKTTTSHREYRWSKEFALENGYQFINFVEHYPNNIPYITERLHKYL